MGKILTPATIAEIQAMREEKDPWGKPKHSHLDIADTLGVSETTVFRALHRRGAYRTLQAPKTEEDAKESQARMAKMLEGLVVEVPELPNVMELTLNDKTKPDMSEEAKARAAQFMDSEK